MRLQLTRALVVWAALAGVARADGVVEARGAYYKERSTLVIQPMIDAALEAGEAGTVDAHFLVDSITSASAATGAVGGEFTELRYEGGLAYLHEVLPELRVGGMGRYSVESDYTSSYLAVHGELDFLEKNTTIAVTEGRGFDDITNGIAVEQGAIGTQPRSEKLRTGLTSLSVTQIFTPWLLGNVTYDFMDLHGYQANVYRLVTGAGVPVGERVPHLRLRHALSTGVRAFAAGTGSTVALGYRFYADDWGIVGHTPEARVIQEIVPGLDLRGRFRYHHQSQAEFYEEAYTADQIMAAVNMEPGAYITNDEKLSNHTTILFGGQVSLAFSLFGVEGPWGDARLDVVVERILQTTSFGDAWNAQLGFSAPVQY